MPLYERRQRLAKNAQADRYRGLWRFRASRSSGPSASRPGTRGRLEIERDPSGVVIGAVARQLGTPEDEGAGLPLRQLHPGVQLATRNRVPVSQATAYSGTHATRGV
jgi:hypothetical protein